MGVKVKLTGAQAYVLRRLSEGRKIVHSQDGDRAWFYPGREFLKIDWIELDDMRQAKLIGDDPDHVCDEIARFHPCDVITEAGRRALSEHEGK